MKILMVVPHFPLPKGGIELHVRGLSRNLVQSGHDVVMITPSPKNVHINFEGAEIFGIKSFNLSGWPYHSLKSFSIPYHPWSLISRIRKLIHKYEFDVLHAHGQKYLYTWVAIDIASREKVPIILTIHGTYGLKYYGYMASFIEETINKTLLRKALRRASAVICPTQVEVDYVQRYYNGVDFFKIPNAVDVQRFSNALKFKEKHREKYKIPLDKKVILFVGRFTYVKGILELMSSVKSVTEAFPEAYFVIVGDGPLRNKVEKLEKLNRDKVRIFSWIPHSEIHELYALSDVFVLSSRSEGLPLAIMEAMASQLYIVSTPVGGVPDTLAEYKHKVYINEVSPSEISGGIVKALEEVSDVKAIDTETLSSIEKFDWANVRKEIERVYKHVL